MLLNLKILFRNFQNNLNNDILQIWQDKLLETQLMKTDSIAKNDQQNNENHHDTKTSLYNWKAWYAVITTNENMTK